MENVLLVVLIIFILLLACLVVGIVSEVYKFFMPKIYTNQKKIDALLSDNDSDIIYVDVTDANFDYAGDNLMYATLGGKYLAIEVSSSATLTVSKDPIPFFNKNVDALISYISLYTDKPVKVNYPEK